MYSLEKIIKGCQQNRMKYQKMLYDLYADKMFGICIRYAKTREEAEDVFQDAFVKVFKYIESYSFTGSFDGWIRKIFMNTSISNYRKNSKTYYTAGEEVAELHHSKLQPFEEIQFTQEELLGVIRELPDGYRIVFNLYAVEGYKHKEIAEILDIDINTSKSQLYRAKKMLQEKLEKLSERKIIITNE